MTRTMADATSANYQAGISAGTQLLGVYVTGTPDVQWTAAELAAIPAGVTVVTIDQGYQSPPVTTATVRDVEAGAWSVDAAVDLSAWTAARPTIYCSADMLPAVGQAGWQRDVWVADYVASAPAAPYPVPAGMTCVAWQWTDQGGGGAYDLSVVFDPWWPQLAPEGVDDVEVGQYATTAQIVAVTGAPGDVFVFEQATAGGSWSMTGGNGQQGTPATPGPVPLPHPVTVAMQIVADVPNLFIQCSDPVAADNGDVYTSSKQADGTWSAWVQI
jgi:hypothetical protein